MLELVSPIGYPRMQSQAQRRSLETPVGRRVGFIWNQYPVTKGFWERFESAFEELSSPLAVERAYKNNTWAPLDAKKFEQVAAAVDYFIVGVGA